MKKIINYKCNYCEYTSSNMDEVVEHELLCLSDPKNKGCLTCTHFIEGLFISDYCKFRSDIPTTNCQYYEETKLRSN